MIHIHIFTFIVASFVLCTAQDPQFEVQHNPGCDAALCQNGTQLLYGRLRRAADSLHVFVSVGEGLGDLAVSYLQSDDPNQAATVDWDKIFSGDDHNRSSALMLKNPMAKTLARFSILFSNLVQYSDTDDTADPNSVHNASLFKYYPLGSFMWQLQPSSGSCSDCFVLFANRSMASQPDDASPSGSIFQPDGYLQISVQLSPSTKRGAAMPQLQFTGNNTQLEFLMYHLNSSLSNARFYLEAALVDSSGRSQKLTNTMSIDDEYTPGIFKVTNWVSGGDSSGTCYAQWKPVCYKAEPRTIGASTVVTYSSNGGEPWLPASGTADALNASFVYTLLGGADPVTVGGARAVNVTFGLTDDKFYADTSYAVWTMSLGLGQPPEDTVSPLVIIVILCGLGLPAALMLAALGYLLVRRIRASSEPPASAYEPINA